MNQADHKAGSAGVVRVAGVRKTYESEGMPVRALRGVDLTVARGEFVAMMGPSGLRQVDPAQPGRRSRHARRGRSRQSPARRGRLGRERPGPHAPPPHRHRLPVLQPARGHDRAWRTSPCRRWLPAPHAGRRDPGPRSARPARAARQVQRRTGGAVRRAAPAAGHRPRPGQRADLGPGRRADRRPRLATAGRRSWSCSGACTPAARPS